jgi:Rrf2 family protein
MSNISHPTDCSHRLRFRQVDYFCAMFSKTFGYALRAATFVAVHGKNGEKIGLQELSQSLDIPHHFLGKIMQDLVRHGILDSIKGPSGGFYANEQTAETPLIELLKITDGSLVFNQCALNIKRCNAEHPCPLHHDFASCRDGMLKAMSAKTIAVLAAEIEEGKSFLVR